MPKECDYRPGNVAVPRAVVDLISTKAVNATDVSLLLLVEALVTTDGGCPAPNEYFAKKLDVRPRWVQKRIAHLKGLGLLKQVGFDGRNRYLETAWSREPKNGGNGRDDFDGEVASQATPRMSPTRERRAGAKGLLKTSLRHLQTTKPAGNGFGIADVCSGAISEFDRAAAAQLQTAIKTLPPRRTGVLSSKPSTWGEHLRLLRVRDGVSEKRITEVLDWYATHIGREFVPQAYSGKSFRRKFPAIEAQMERDVVSVVKVGEEAKRIATRLEGMGWPKGSGSAVPAACQACLNGYRAWLAALHVFMDKLRRDDLVEDYGTERARMLRFGVYLIELQIPPAHLVEQWMRAVYERVRGWAGWRGDFGPFIFEPRAERFQQMGRGWAVRFTGHQETWDRFQEVMACEG